MLKTSLDAALAETGQSLTPGPDGRTPQEQLIHRQMGVRPRSAADYDFDGAGQPVADGVSAGQLAAAPNLDPFLAGVIARDLRSNANSDPAATRKLIEGAGQSYDDVVKAVQTMFNERGITLKANTLPAHTLAQLNIWSKRLQQHAAARKQQH